MKKWFQLNEKQLGYAFVLPALLLVFVVIIWPIIQSFWNSMFDYRLNDPTRSEKMMSSNIDLENYLDDHFYIPRQLDSITETTDDPQVTDAISEIEEGIESYHSEL